MSMAHKIQPGEFFDAHVYAINTRCPKEQITEAMIVALLVARNHDLNDLVRVSVTNHERTETLYIAEFQVTGRSLELRRVENINGDSRTEERAGITIQQTMPWTPTVFGKALEIETAKAKKAA